MPFLVVRIEAYIIEVYHDALDQKFLEDLIYIVLEDAGRVSKPEWHNGEFSQPITSAESTLPLVSFLNAAQAIHVL